MAATYLKLETVTGARPIEVLKDATRVATMLGVNVEMDVNGVTVLALPGDSHLDLHRNWQAALEGKQKFASALK